MHVTNTGSMLFSNWMSFIVMSHYRRVGFEVNWTKYPVVSGSITPPGIDLKFDKSGCEASI